jgi:hypothetical protein
MKFDIATEAFITNYVKALKEKNAVVFAGAGMSVSQGFFDWKTLLKPVADQLGLDIENEQHNLPALAQYFVDKKGGVRNDLSQIIYDEYTKANPTISNNHKILARLPIQIYWTTNYDNLIEKSLEDEGKTPDVKKTKADLTVNKSKRDAIVYKMHGDIGTPAETVLTKHEYEDYNIERELFSNAFKSDYVARTFLFIGFSFSDPNLDFLISRIRSILGKESKTGYYLIKREKDNQKKIKQELKANSLLRYGLNAIWIDDYSEITNVLKEIEARYKRNTVLISGSAEIYEPFDKDIAIDFIHDLSKTISARNYKVLTGFGLGVGSAVINGVLENMENQRTQNVDNFLIMRPFPQFHTKGKDIQELWTDYRRKFIPLAGIAVFIFGNKLNKSTVEIVQADGLIKEFDIAVENGLKVIPIGATGYVSKELYEKVLANLDSYFENANDIKDEFIKLGEAKDLNGELINSVLKIINHLNK